MTISDIVTLIIGITIGLSLKILWLYGSLSLQLDRVTLTAQRAEIMVDLLKERTLNEIEKLEVRIIHLESVIFVDESEGDYEAPALTPYGEMPGWKGAQRGTE